MVPQTQEMRSGWVTMVTTMIVFFYIYGKCVSFLASGYKKTWLPSVTSMLGPSCIVDGVEYDSTSWRVNWVFG